MASHRPIASDTRLEEAAAKLQRARDNEGRFSQKEQAIRDEQKQLQERVRWLNTLLRLNGGQHNDWLSRVHDRSIVPYCQAWNTKFAETIQAHLPVEIRNTVYYHLWDKDTITAFPDLSKVAGGSTCLEKPCRCSKPHERPLLPHFIIPSFMGHSAAQEIVRALYDAFHYRDKHLTIRLPKYILSAFSKDKFQVNFDPSLHLRSLVIRIKLDRLRKHKTPHTASTTCAHTKAEKIYTEDTELKAQLSTLLKLQYKPKFELRINLFQRNVRISVLEEVLLAVADVRKALQDRNVEVIIEWTYRGNWRYGEFPDDVDLLTKNMDDFYTLSRKTWRSNMVNFLVIADMNDMFQDRHIRFFNEPCMHVPDNAFVHAMWDDSESEWTTDGEEDDQEVYETSDEDDDEDDEDDSASWTMQTCDGLIQNGTASELWGECGDECGDEVENT